MVAEPVSQIISGGVKVNALPERVEMMMNFRIDFASSIKESESRLAIPDSRCMMAHLRDSPGPPVACDLPRRESQQLDFHAVPVQGRAGQRGPRRPIRRFPGVWHSARAGTVYAGRGWCV